MSERGPELFGLPKGASISNHRCDEDNTDHISLLNRRESHMAKRAGRLPAVITNDTPLTVGMVAAMLAGRRAWYLYDD